MERQKFKKSENIYKPAPFWGWNDKLENDELFRQIEEMKKTNWGGFFIHSRVGLITPYLSKRWFELVKACVKKAAKTGLRAWIYDEDKWPSGFAGGAVPAKGEKYRHKVLILRKSGEEQKEDTLIKKVTYNGRQYSIVKHTQPMGNVKFNYTGYVDLMDDEVVGAFLESTHEKYKKQVGKYFGKEIPGVFTDEPCYMMHNFFQDSIHLPWSNKLLVYFKKLKKYSLIDHIEKLFFKIGDYHKVRFDFFDSALNLFRDSFTKKYYIWCEKNNLKFTGHFMMEDSLLGQAQWIGAAMPHYEYMQWPGIDILRKNIGRTVTVKQASSVAEQLGKERVLSETFAVVGNELDFKTQRWIGDWQAALGVSFLNQSIALYSMRGERKRDFPCNIFYQQPWWKYESLMSQYQARVCYIVSSGKRVIDLLVFHPGESVWCEYDAREKNFEKLTKKYDDPFKDLTDTLIVGKYDFHYFDEIIAENHCTVQSNKLKVGHYQYNLLIIPPSLTWRKNTFEVLEKFVDGGGKVIGFGKKPELINGEKNIRIKNLLKNVKYFNKLFNLMKYLKLIKEPRLKAYSKNTGKQINEVIFQERIDNKKHIYFINYSSNEQKTEAELYLRNEGQWEYWDLFTGEIKPITPQSVKKDYSKFTFTFEPGASIVLTCAPGQNNLKPEKKIKKEVITKFDKYKIKALDENVLLIDRVTLDINNKTVLKDAPIFMAWNDYFYKAKDGTPFKAVYKFECEEIPSGEIYAVIEAAKNLKQIKINNNTVKPGDLLYLKDPYFNKVNISEFIKIGANEIILEGKKINNVTGSEYCAYSRNIEDDKRYNSTEIEPVFITGDFKVNTRENKKFTIVRNSSIKIKADNLTAGGYPFYTGSFSLKTEFNYNKSKYQKSSGQKIYIEIEHLVAPAVEIKINNKKTGTLLWEPLVMDILKYIHDGRNEIELIIPTTLFNLMGPNKTKKPFSGRVGPWSFRNWDDYKEEYTFIYHGVGSMKIFKEL